MTLVNICIFMMIILFLFFCLYTEVILPKKQGDTFLKISLVQGNRIDGGIFILLIAVFLGKNIYQHGDQLTTYLLGFLIIICIYTFYLRVPKLFLKQKGIIFANAFIDYERFKQMHLTEQGELVIQLEKRPIKILVKNVDDLGLIYHQLKPLYLDKVSSLD